MIKQHNRLPWVVMNPPSLEIFKALSNLINLILVWADGFNWVISRGPFQTQTFCKSVTCQELLHCDIMCWAKLFLLFYSLIIIWNVLVLSLNLEVYKSSSWPFFEEYSHKTSFLLLNFKFFLFCSCICYRWKAWIKQLTFFLSRRVSITTESKIEQTFFFHFLNPFMGLPLLRNSMTRLWGVRCKGKTVEYSGCTTQAKLPG